MLLLLIISFFSGLFAKREGIISLTLDNLDFIIYPFNTTCMDKIFTMVNNTISISLYEKLGRCEEKCHNYFEIKINIISLVITDITYPGITLDRF